MPPAACDLQAGHATVGPCISVNGHTRAATSPNTNKIMGVQSLDISDGMQIITWFLAASPTRRSESVKATYDGVVRLPWSLATISTRSFCHTPTHEYVVPRSIPAAAACDDALESERVTRCFRMTVHQLAPHMPDASCTSILRPATHPLLGLTCCPNTLSCRKWTVDSGSASV